jgi:hypothetical protein
MPLYLDVLPIGQVNVYTLNELKRFLAIEIPPNWILLVIKLHKCNFHDQLIPLGQLVAN